MPHISWRRGGDPGKALRELLEEKEVVVAPGVYCPAVALLAEKMGFKALYVSGAAITGLLAMPDIGLITLEEMAIHLRWISRVTRLPLIVDVDTGFGEAVNVMRTVRTMIEAGAAAVQIEDQLLPKKCGHLKGKQLIDAEEMAKKIVAATKARGDSGLVIIARTDARGVTGLDDAVERAKIYLEMGADVIFPEALRNKEEFEEFSRRVRAPLLANMTEFGVTPYMAVDEFRRMGYKIVIFPVTTFRASLKASQRTLETILREGTQESIIDELMSRQEFYELINYRGYEDLDSTVSKDVEAMRKL